MRRPILLALALAALAPLAGCIGKAGADQDPFAYMRKPLYSSTFFLDSVGEGTDEQMFHIQDGSIVTIRLQVWVNATAGAATVRVTNPSGQVVMETSETTAQTLPVELGRWIVQVEGRDAPAGTVGVHVTRN